MSTYVHIFYRMSSPLRSFLGSRGFFVVLSFEVLSIFFRKSHVCISVHQSFICSWHLNLNFFFMCVFYVLSVKKPKQPTKECTYSSTVVKRMPAPPPTEYYSCPSSQDAGVNYPMGNFHGNTCSLPSDYSVLSESNSNIPVPYMGEMKNNVIGVLRVNCNSLDLSRSDYVSDISSCSSVDSCSNVLNDLSSVDTSVVPSVPSNSMLSFKNI